MDDTLPSRLLQRQHRQIDEGIENIVNGKHDFAALAQSLGLLRVHIYVEEEFLFPPLQESGLTMPIFVMKREHGEMWPFIDTLAAACESAAGPTAADLHDTALALLRLLQVHNPKEEEIVYTAADRLAAEAGEAPWRQPLETAEIPSGWRCAMAGSDASPAPFLR